MTIMNTKLETKRFRNLRELMQDTDPSLPQRVEALRRRHSMGREIEQRRIVAGLTQAELARRIGCTQSRISKLERSENEKISLVDFMKCVMATSAKQGNLLITPDRLTEQITMVNWGMFGNFVEKLVASPLLQKRKTQRKTRRSALA